MIRAIFWKEWHEHRSKYLFYWFAVNAPMLILAVAIAVSAGARVPFADLSDTTAIKYLPLSLVQSFLAVTLFLILTGYLAVATFSPEIDDRSLFFMYEQPVPRKQYLVVKLMYGALHVVLATCCAILLFPVAAFIMMLLSGKVTADGSGATFLLVMGAAARATVWSSLISLAGFTASTLVSALVPRWWLASACSILLTMLMIYEGIDFFSIFPDMPDNSMSIGFSLSTGNAQWITISRAVTPAELSHTALWRAWPLLAALLLIAAFSTSTAVLLSRKELK